MNEVVVVNVCLAAGNQQPLLQRQYIQIYTHNTCPRSLNNPIKLQYCVLQYVTVRSEGIKAKTDNILYCFHSTNSVCSYIFIPMPPLL
jgi:hypothetical protein